MNSANFIFWLKGFLASAGEGLTKEQLEAVNEQLDSVDDTKKPVYRDSIGETGTPKDSNRRGKTKTTEKSVEVLVKRRAKATKWVRRSKPGDPVPTLPKMTKEEAEKMAKEFEKTLENLNKNKPTLGGFLPSCNCHRPIC